MVYKKLIFTFIFSLLLSISHALALFGGARVIDLDFVTKGANDSWYNTKVGERDSIRAVIKHIQKSKTGRHILAKAQKKAAKRGLTLIDIISVGDGSLTDTTLIRKFSPDSPDQIFYESKSHVFLNKDLTFLNATLDLTHELTHYTYRDAFNPYRSQFSLDAFVKSTIEGKGGEVDAYLVECKVMGELYPSRLKNHSNCTRVLDKNTGKLSKAMAIKEFYKVGSHYRDVKKYLNTYGSSIKDLKSISNDEGLFISSAYSLPYPLAALKEYVSIMDRACLNDRKRLSIFQENAQGRSVASVKYSSPKRSQLYKTMKESYQSRCNMFD